MTQYSRWLAVLELEAVATNTVRVSWLQMHNISNIFCAAMCFVQLKRRFHINIILERKTL
jgi:hypothetical protein